MEPTISVGKAELDCICGLLPKVDKIDSAVQALARENTVLRSELAQKEAKISQLTDQGNRQEQALRACSLRILGLPLTATTPPGAVPDIVFKEVIAPCLEEVKKQGEISPCVVLALQFIVAKAFFLPAKRKTPSYLVAEIASPAASIDLPFPCHGKGKASGPPAGISPPPLYHDSPLD